MGRDWYSWGTTTKSSKREPQPKQKKYVHATGAAAAAAATTSSAVSPPSGCMCAVFNLFDFHHFHSALHQHSSFTSNSVLLDDSPSTTSKGIEAPRNSLELVDEPSTTQSTVTEREDLNLPVKMQIRTSRNILRSHQRETLAEISYSPGAKTPTLVARLMGLDLLPDKALSSPSSSSSQATPCHQTKSLSHQKYRPRHPHQTKPFSHHRNSFDGDLTGTRSLPETPRISLGRRSDVDQRFSLQMNKENMSATEEMVLSRLRKKALKTDDQEQHTRSPSHYARQIVKQVKESVSKRVNSGLVDITNTTKNRRDVELLNQIKHSTSSSAPSSNSPRLKHLESKYKTVAGNCSSQANKARDHSATQSSQSLSSIKPQELKQKPIKNCKKLAEEKFSAPSPKRNGQTSTNVIRNKQEDTFVRSTTAIRAAGMRNPDKKCNKTPLSSDLLNLNVPTLIPLSKDSTPPSTTKIIQKQVSNTEEESKRRSQLSRCLSHSYNSPTPRFDNRDVIRAENTLGNQTNGPVTSSQVSREYITGILTRTGVDMDTPLPQVPSFTSLDASIFYHLEQSLFTNTRCESTVWGSLIQRCNRKLLFHLVEEILVCDVAGTDFTTKFGVGRMKGSELVDTLVSKVTSFPGMDCRVLEDIDALVEKDWGEVRVQYELGIGELREEIVMEIEMEIFETLIHEATSTKFDTNYKRLCLL